MIFSGVSDGSNTLGCMQTERTLRDGISNFEDSGGMRACGEGCLASKAASWEPSPRRPPSRQGVGMLGFPILSAVEQQQPSRGTRMMNECVS